MEVYEDLKMATPSVLQVCTLQVGIEKTQVVDIPPHHKHPQTLQTGIFAVYISERFAKSLGLESGMPHE